MGRKVKQKDLVNKANKYKYDFQQYETLKSFFESIYTGKTSIDEAEMDQSNLLKYLVEFSEQTKPRTREGKDENRNTCKCSLWRSRINS